jgi:hypothetical protein
MQVDKLSGISENILFGQRPRIGAASVEVCVDIPKLASAAFTVQPPQVESNTAGRLAFSRLPAFGAPVPPPPTPAACPSFSWLTQLMETDAPVGDEESPATGGECRGHDFTVFAARA